jgi:hypothetical protein
MAIDKLKYIKPGKDATARAKAKLAYIGRDKEETPRELFGHDGVFTKEQAEEMIDNAPKNTYFWSLILSPDRKTENIEKKLNLRKLTKEFIEFLEVRLNRPNIPFVAAEHSNTDNPHTHTLFFLQRQGRALMITPTMLKEFYQKATEMALSQKTERGRFKEPRHTRTLRAALLQTDHAHSEGGPIHPVYGTQACSRCDYIEPLDDTTMDRHRCPKCGGSLERNYAIAESGQEAAWSR